MAIVPDQQLAHRRAAAADAIGGSLPLAPLPGSDDAEYLRQAGELLERSPDAVLRIDPSLRVTHANRACRRIFAGFSYSLIGARLGEIVGQTESGAQFEACAAAAFSSCADATFTLAVSQPSAVQHYEVRLVPLISGATATHLFASFRDISARLAKIGQLDQALREQEAIFEGTAAGLFVSRNRIFVKVNRQLETMFGYAPGELLGMHSSAFWMSREESDRISAANLARLQAGEIVRRQALFSRKDGSTFWAETINRPLVPGRPDEGVIGVIIDISEQKAQEQALRDTEALLESIVENLPVMLSVKDADSLAYIRFNRAAEIISGWQRGDAIGKTVFDLYPHFLAEGYAAADRAAIAGKMPTPPSQELLITGSGETRQIVTRSVPIVAADGQVHYLMTIAEDVTEQRAAELALRESEARFRQFADNVDQLFFITNPERTVWHYVNNAHFELWGVPAAEARRNPHFFVDYIDADCREAALALFESDRRGQGTESEMLINHPTKGRRWIHSRTFPVAMDTGELRVFGIAEDVTARRMREEARIREAMQQRDVLVREVHHRIKNNLQGVAGLLEHTARIKPMFAREINEVISQIQAIAQVHGLLVREGGELSLRALTRAIVDSLKRTSASPFEFHDRIDSGEEWTIPEYEAVPLALVTNELLGNALKYSVAGSVVVATLFPSGEGVTWRVSNAGSLPDGFDFATISAGAAGLSLVKALLPRKGASLAVRQHDQLVVAELVLLPPAVRLLSA